MNDNLPSNMQSGSDISHKTSETGINKLYHILFSFWNLFYGSINFSGIIENIPDLFVKRR